MLDGGGGRPYFASHFYYIMFYEYFDESWRFPLLVFRLFSVGIFIDQLESERPECTSLSPPNLYQHVVSPINIKIDSLRISMDEKDLYLKTLG